MTPAAMEARRRRAALKTQYPGTVTLQADLDRGPSLALLVALLLLDTPALGQDQTRSVPYFPSPISECPSLFQTARLLDRAARWSRGGLVAVLAGVMEISARLSGSGCPPKDAGDVLSKLKGV